MKRIDIKVTYRCNNRCKFCVQGDKREVLPDRELADIERILKVSRPRYEGVVFTGGEATIRRDILSMVRSAKGLGYRVQIQTNGRMLAYKNFCEEMGEAGVDEFAVSIHGHNAKLHDYLTGVDGSFMQTRAGIIHALSCRKTVLTNTVLNKLNYKFLPELAELLAGLRITNFKFSYPHILGEAYVNRDQMVPRKSEIAPYVIKGLAAGITKGCFPKTEAIPYCLLQGYEKCVSEATIPETKVFEKAFCVPSFTRWRKTQGKAKGPRCKKCRWFVRCEGPWREYPRLYGWSEFIPVK